MRHSVGVACLLLLAAARARADRAEDWLVQRVRDPAVVRLEGSDIIIENGLVSRRFVTRPAFGTVDVRLNASTKLGGEQSLFRAVKPEASLVLDGTPYTVGGLEQESGFLGYCNRTSLTLRARDATTTFTFAGYNVSAPVAPFPWTPGTRHSAKQAWPPEGVTLSVRFVSPAGAPKVLVTVYYQALVGVPVLQKWLTVESQGDTVSVTGATVEILAVNSRFGRYYDIYPGHDRDGVVTTEQPLTLLHAKTDQAHVAQCAWQDDRPNDNINIPGCPDCKDEGASEPVLNCSYTLGPGAVVSPTESFESFKVLSLVADSAEVERHTLSRHRVTEALAPHTTENPVFFHGTDASEAGFKAAIDQMAEVGFEMFIFSFGSGFNLESTDPAYLQQMKDLIAYARAKGIEVGGYDLICLTRGVKDEWKAVGNEGNACFASGYYDYLSDVVTNFIQDTGLAMLETDGPYGGGTCASESHAHHHSITDSVYRQTQLQNDFYKKMRALNVYVNQPDDFFFQGGSRTGMGYNEQQYSLPRWEDLTISRQGMYDDLYDLLPTQGWMFLPLSQYHAGGDAATFQGHNVEYEWGLAQYLGAGTAACYRGPKPYTSDAMKAILQKWIGIYKAHRETLIKSVVHLRRADMQGWDGWLHVNPQSSTDEVGFAMLFNPTSEAIKPTISINLYYTGLDTTTMVAVNDATPVRMQLARDYTVTLTLDMPAKSIHYVSFARGA